MKIRMTQSAMGSATPTGSRAMRYQRGKVYDMSEPWRESLAKVFVGEGWAEEVAPEPEAKTVEAAPERKVVEAAPETKAGTRGRGRPRKTW